MGSSLFTPLKAGAILLPNRIVMAPLTRGRADPEGVPTALMADYYAQRAGARIAPKSNLGTEEAVQKNSGAGLIIAEATAVSRQGYGWLRAPGIFTEAQAQGWRGVTDAVHQAGGRIFLQLWHMGRTSHPDFLGGDRPVAPSAIPADGHTTTPLGKKDYVMPRALEAAELGGIADDYRAAAQRAKDAGFDGAEVHAANGYLIDEFLRDGANRRKDDFGGSAGNRARFLQMVTEAVIDVWGGGRVGVRFSPRNLNKGMHDGDPIHTFSVATEKLNAYDLAYLHVIEPLPGHRLSAAGERVTPHLRKIFKGAFIVNGGYTKESGEEAIARGEADAVAYGVPFIANPDLVRRFQTGAALNVADESTFYTHEAKGYTDYPALGN